MDPDGGKKRWNGAWGGRSSGEGAKDGAKKRAGGLWQTSSNLRGQSRANGGDPPLPVAFRREEKEEPWAQKKILFGVRKGGSHSLPVV